MNLSILLEQPSKKLALFGSSDKHLRMIRENLGVTVMNRNDEIRLSGLPDQVAKAAAVLDQMQRKLRKQDWLSPEDVGEALKSATRADERSREGEIDVYAKTAAVKPKTDGQKRYMEAIFANDLTFCLGPAGTGKTYLAVAAAAKFHLNAGSAGSTSAHGEL